MDHLERTRHEFSRQAANFASSVAITDQAHVRKLIDPIGAAAQGRVLDVACGPGIVAAELAGIAREVVALDLTPEMLVKARERCAKAGRSNVRFKEGAADALPFDDASFDAVVTRLSFHHFIEEGAHAMIEDGLFKRFPKPDVILGQHVMVGPSGTVAGCAGAITSAADSLQIRLFGRGAHGSMPQAAIDPVVMAAATVMRLQTVVSREVAAAEAAVVTVGVLQAGTKENVIPDEAVIKLNVRTFDAGVRTRVLAAIERIVKAEAAASGAPRAPEITNIDHYPLNVNNRDASKRVVEAFRGHFGAARVHETAPAPASEDFGSFGAEWHVPSVFWFVGGTDPQVYATAKAANTLNELPVNHSPKFAPVLDPTLQTGVETLVVATRAWLCQADVPASATTGIAEMATIPHPHECGCRAMRVAKSTST